MKIPSMHQQMFGNINKQLSQIRAKMNAEIKEKCLETLEKKKEESEGGKDAIVV